MNQKDFKGVRKIVLVSNIYDILALAVVIFKSTHVGIFLLILGLINLLFVKKIEDFNNWNDYMREVNAKKYKIFALILQAINIFTLIVFAGLCNSLKGRMWIGLESIGLLLKCVIIILVMDSTADELKIKWKNKKKRE